MKRALIAVVDAARARLFAYEDGTPLRELRDLSNAGRTMRTGELMSNTEGGRGLASDGGVTKGYQRSATDDHRDDQVAMHDHKFAKVVIDSVDELIKQDGVRHLIVIAPPKMLGELRQVDGVLHRDDLVIDEIQQDLTKLSTSQLHDHLASMELIHGRIRLAAGR